ncbi:MAG: hypothetical protein K5839_01295 [Treponemataceae bacterium]|nr:hypothetical protein [Treponemataceae bacterium]
MLFFLKLAFLFSMGSFLGWCLEVIYRRIVHKKWINPGFLTGPCLPLYGFSLVSLYLLAQIDVSFITNPIWEKVVLFVIMALCITLVEYFAGLIFIKGMKIKLWDYSACWGNIQGIICPLYTFFWYLLSALYYFLVHPRILNSLSWLSSHIAFSFVIGIYYGILMVDLVHSFKVVNRIRQFAKEKQIVVRLESFKESIEQKRFMAPLQSEMEILRYNLSLYMENEKKEIKAKAEELERKQKAKIEKLENKIKNRRNKK